MDERKRVVVEVGRHLMSPPVSVDVDMSVDERRRLFEHIARAWTQLGETEPYESVLYAREFRMTNFEEHAAVFDASGAGDLELIRAFFRRNGEPLDAVRSVLEIGCGVGRVTAHLAGSFDRVVAVDISPGHLRLARARVERLGYKNVEFIQMRSPEDYGALPACDLLFSRIVLQHDPPPLINWILRTVLGGLEEGRHCLFQVPTHAEPYNFSLSRYLETGGNEFNLSAYVGTDVVPDLNLSLVPVEMHLLPQRTVHEILRQARFALLECSEDAAAGLTFQSQFFFGRKLGP